MNTKWNIDFIKKINDKDLSLISQVSRDNYYELKNDTDNFIDFETLFEVVPEAEEMLDVWVRTVRKQGIFPLVRETETKSKPLKKATTKKPERSNKEDKAKKANEKFIKQRDTLKGEVELLRIKVLSNAKFKEKLSEELQKYIDNNATGLSGSKIEIEITILKNKKKFYGNLLKGDVSDFKAIALRVGLDYRKSKPKQKKETNLSGIPQAIAGTKKRVSLIDKFKNWWDN